MTENTDSFAFMSNILLPNTKDNTTDIKDKQRYNNNNATTNTEQSVYTLCTLNVLKQKAKWKIDF